jgi:4-alpha-glucanotransferase
MPLYRWDEIRQRNFDWWRQRVRGVKNFFHIFRIDHVLGFYRIYAFPWRPSRNQEFLPLSQEEMRARTNGKVPHFVPRDDSTAENCEANRRDGEEYLRLVLEEAAETRVAGEDLGTVPDYVRPSLHGLGIAGFKIPHWESYSDGRVVSGSEYERLSVTTYATHDHKPLRAFWEEAFEKQTSTSDQARHELIRIAQFAALPTPNEQMDYKKDFYPSIMEALFQSEAWIAIVMITDLLARKDRFNVPGMSVASNWTRRMHATVAELSSRPAVKRQMRLVRTLLEKTGRV